MAFTADTFGDIGGAVNSIFGAIGDKAAASGYDTAARLSLQNEQIAKASTGIQLVQADRQIFQTIGGQKADVAGAGLAASGSALDLLRSSVQQGALTKQLLANQGAITATGYEAEAASYHAQASASNASATGGFIGGALKAVGAAASIFGLFSDRRLKRNIKLLGRREDGIGVYLFRYKTSNDWYVGVMAQEVLEVHPMAVYTNDQSGYLMVDYDAIGEKMLKVCDAEH